MLQFELFFLFFLGWTGVQGLKSWWITSSNLLVWLTSLSANLNSLCNELTPSDVDGILVHASRSEIKARTTQSVNEQINIYAFPLANTYQIWSFIIRGAAQDCSQQGRCPSSFRFAPFFCIRLCIFTPPPHNQTSRQPLFCAPCHWYCWGLSSLTDKGPIGTDWALIEAWRTGVSMCSSPFSTQEE